MICQYLDKFTDACWKSYKISSLFQVCFFIIQLLLLKPSEFRTRVSEIVRTMSPEHQLIKDFHKTHLEFHQKFPERFTPGLNGASQQPDFSAAGGDGRQNEALPTYFGNICLRFIPVFDIVVHRFLELPPVSKSLETLIDHIGVFYKFHQKPITYLYNTLHYYEKRVRDKPSLKKKLISSITGALKDIRPQEWCLTSNFLKYLSCEDDTWAPKPDYFIKLVGRFTHALEGGVDRHPFPPMDWRFNEFPNEGAHAMYVTCVEIMGLPGRPHEVGAALLDVVLECSHVIPREELPDWINAIGILISNLPEAYWEGLYNKLVTALNMPPLSQWTATQVNPFKVFNFSEVHEVLHRSGPSYLSYLLALGHSVFHHSGFTQIQVTI
jgi:mediator of RNA polymerase II transcription subunit 23